MVAFHSALGDLSLFIIFLESFHYKMFFVFHLLLLSLLLLFVLASNRICLRTWHVATLGRKKRSCRTFLRRQPAYLQLFDCLTQRLEAQKKRSRVGGSRHMENFACSSLSSGKQQQQEEQQAQRRRLCFNCFSASFEWIITAHNAPKCLHLPSPPLPQPNPKTQSKPKNKPRLVLF